MTFKNYYQTLWNMPELKPKYITDSQGNKISVVLSIEEFNEIMEEIEELEDIKLYDEAKREDTGERILFSDYVKNRKSNGKIRNRINKESKKTTG